MKKWIIGLSLLLTISYSGFSQKKQVCGTIDQTLILERLDANKRLLKQTPAMRNSAIFFVPVQFHIVTKSDGSGALGEENILAQLCRLNEDFKELNIVFYLKKDFNYIAYTKLYEEPGHTFSALKMATHKVNDAINVYIVNQIGDNDTGTTLAYYQGNNDWIVVIKDRVNGGTQTLSHEIGHFFSLAHPFNGWECGPYTAAQHGNPVNITTVPCSGALIELVDRSNCEVAADQICDTPPDYNFGLTDPEDNCSLDYEVKDYNGDIIYPIENNFMGYFFNCQDYSFTQTQIDLMRVDYQTSGRAYLRGAYVPDTTELSGEKPIIISPAYNSTTLYYDEVLLDWEDVEGASSYLVKLTIGFFNKTERYYHVKNKSELLLNDLPKDEKNITMLVWAYNDGNSCGSSPSQTHKFKTSAISVGVEDLEDSGRFKVYPSPLPLRKPTLILMSDSYYADVKLELISMNGKVFFKSTNTLRQGKNYINLDKSSLVPGIYILKLTNEMDSYSKRILIAE